MNPLKQYSDLINLIETDAASREDVYTELIKKEEKVLDVISRVATQNDKKKTHKFSDLSIAESIARFANTWKNIFVESVEAKSKDPRIYASIIMKDDRKIYVGLMMVIFAMFLYFISVGDM